MAHVPVLGLIVTLALGLVSLALIARLPHRDVPAGIAWLPVTLLLYNLWVAGFLAVSYLQQQVVAPPAVPRTLPTDLVGAALGGLALGWLYAQVAQLVALLGRDSTRALPAVRVTLGLVGVMLAAAWLIGWASGHPVIFHALAWTVRLAVFPAALAATVVFLVGARSLEDPYWRGRLRKLGLGYAVLFACLSVLSAGWGRLAALSPALPLALDVLLELLYNVAAIVWVTRLGTPPRERAPVPLSHGPGAGPDMIRLFGERGITRREAEIIELICLGQTNQEIADRLFISLSTVKDHNYITFQKLGVRNRTELTRLVLSLSRSQPK